jgi:hypothetical protein
MSIPRSIPFETVRILSAGFRIVISRFRLLVGGPPSQVKNQLEYFTSMLLSLKQQSTGNLRQFCRLWQH